VCCSSTLRGTRGAREAERVARVDLHQLAALRSAAVPRFARPAGFVPSAPPLGVLVVISELRDQKSLACYLVDNAMLIGDPARPKA
jgi:hypothetical protein